VKAAWAVACSLSVSGILLLHGIGFAGEPSRTGARTSQGQVVVVDPSLAAPARGDISRASSAPPPSGNIRPKGEDLSGGPNYLIGPEDVLHVSVWENQELTVDVTVRPDGKISLPLIQDVQAEGLTASELSDVIHRKLEPFILQPQVAVIVTQVNAPKVFVVGNVTKPGPYPLRSDMSVLQALSVAGGFTIFASPKNIKMVRTVKGKQEIRKVNYYDIIEDGKGNYLLQPGDMIVVP
jgi:polysaccharide export outer membrane protein